MWWWGDVPVGGATRPEKLWLSASCPPAAALQSSAGLSTQGAWPAPPALKRSAPPSSPGCIVRENHRRLMMDITMSPLIPTYQTMTKSTARRRTSSRRRRKGVRNCSCNVLFLFSHYSPEICLQWIICAEVIIIEIFIQRDFLHAANSCRPEVEPVTAAWRLQPFWRSECSIYNVAQVMIISICSDRSNGGNIFIN